MIGTEHPGRGEIWLVRLGSAQPGEPGKNRPALVIQANELGPYNDYDLVAVVPVSASRQPSPDRPAIPDAVGLDRPCVAVTRSVRGVARSRLLKKIATVDDETLSKITFALGRVLGVLH